MKNSVKNVILICGISAVAIMCVGVVLYDYIPSGVTVSKANQYETLATTTEILSDAQEAQSLLQDQQQSTTTKAATSPIVKTNIVLKEYDVSKTDLAMYKASGSYQSGRADPFAEVTTQKEETSTSGETTQTNSSSTTTNQSTTSSESSSDGTYYNSSRKK